MILGKLINFALDSISTTIARMRAKTVPSCEAPGDSIGLPERFLAEGFIPLQEPLVRKEIFYPPPWINIADFEN